MRILSVIANGYGSSYYRQLVPMQAMKAAGYPVTLVVQAQVPEGTLEAHDVVQISRVAANNVDEVVEHIRQVQSAGKKIVIDYDDDLITIPDHNPARGIDPEKVIRAVRSADAITVTNDALAAAYRPYAKRLAVVPNYVDARAWPIPSRNGPLTIGLVGSPSHVRDWEIVAEPMARIRREFPNVRFLLAGYVPNYLKELATDTVDWVPVDQYKHVVNCIDIGLAPLISDDFNRKKSPIKALEYALAGAAVVASPTQYMSVVKGRGIIAKDDWYTAIETYITDADRRHRDAQALRSYVLKTFDVRRHASDIYSTYRRLFK